MKNLINIATGTALLLGLSSPILAAPYNPCEGKPVCRMLPINPIINDSWHYLWFDGHDVIAVPAGSYSRSFIFDDTDDYYVGYFGVDDPDHPMPDSFYQWEAENKCRTRSEMRKRQLEKTTVAGITTETHQVIYICSLKHK